MTRGKGRHRIDDAGDDDQPPRLPRDERGRGQARGLRFSPEETERIEQAAERRGVRSGNGLLRFMRNAIMRAVDAILHDDKG